MDRVFVYWDNSNLIHEAQRLAEEQEGTPDARYLVRIHFENLLRLAEAGRPLVCWRINRLKKYTDGGMICGGPSIKR